MKTSKITEIVRTNEWESKYGPMYSITLKMENGETISLNKKKSDAFKVGWTISYEELEPGKKWKEVIEKKPNENNNYNNPKSYFTSIAFQIAFDKLYKGEDDYQNCVYLAKRIFADMLDNYENKG